MADLSDPKLREWVAELKDDANPTSWVLFGYSGKTKIVGEAKGSGEAEEYWEQWRGLLKASEIQFSLVRITMGDAESRRPKFVFVTWLGTEVGVMARSRGGMHKADMKSVMGQFHIELSSDSTDELDLELVKKALKKAMGADYDMGSNSRSASGAEGNADAATGATVRYTTQQSSIKANAAAAYEGGETVKVSGGIGSLSAAPKAASTVVIAERPVAKYKCIKKSQIRAGFEMDSDKAGILDKETTFEAYEQRENDKGVVRVRLDKGWVSEKTGTGVPCLELLETYAVSEPSPAPTPAAAEPPAAASYKCIKKSQIRAGFEMDSDKAGVMAVGDVIEVLESRVNEKGVLRIHFNGGWVSEKTATGVLCLEAVAASAPGAAAAPAPTPTPTAAPTPAPVAAPAAAEPPAAASYKCIKKSQIRAGFEMDSDKAGVMAVGDVIEVLESRVNEKGVLRIHFSGGWVSEKTATGVLCLEAVAASAPGAAAAPVSTSAPASSPTPAPAPVTAATPAPAPTPAPKPSPSTPASASTIDKPPDAAVVAAVQSYSDSGGTVTGDRVVVLMTTSGDQRALRKVADNLARKKVKVEQIDGSAPDNKARRDALWTISERRAVYPQVFVQVGDAPAIFVSAGEDEFDDLVEAGTMDKEILDANPGIPTLDRALAPLLGAAAAPAAEATPASVAAPAPAPTLAAAPPVAKRTTTPPKDAGTPPARGGTEDVDPVALAKLRLLVERLESDAKAKYGYSPPPMDATMGEAPPAPLRAGPGGPPPPPPGPPPNLADLEDKRAGAKPAVNTGALFAELNKGSNITSGLKKVSKQKAASSKVVMKERKTKTKKKMGKPKLAKDGRKWVCEYYIDDRTGNLVISDCDVKETVTIFRCVNAVVQIKGKINAILLDDCDKTSIVCSDVVSSIDIVNCKSCEVQADGRVPTIAVDKTDGCQLYLGAQATDATIILSKSSETNVTTPGATEDDDGIETALPEQFSSIFDKKQKKWLTSSVTHG